VSGLAKIGFLGFTFIGILTNLKSGEKKTKFRFLSFVNLHSFFSEKTVSLSCFLAQVV